MTPEESVSKLIEDVKSGDEQAVRAIWDAYFPRLCRTAAAQLAGQRRADADEEDVALSAFASFCKAAAGDRFPDLADSKGLWRLLSEMTRRKAVDLIRHRNCAKRDVKRTVGESKFINGEGQAGIDALRGDDLTPALSLYLQEEARNRLQSLGDRRLEQLAILKMHGYTNQEVADQMKCSVATIERGTARIRKKWQQDTTE